MDGREFWKQVHADEQMEWLGCRDAGQPDPDQRAYGGERPPLSELMVYVAGPGTPSGAFAIPAAAILEETWEILRDIILGVQMPKVLSHLTRIVGYFSNTKAWNRSKLAELADRQKGAKFLFEPSQNVLNGSPKRNCPCKV